ncbi:MAG TPA: anhydro-N-acetylmuramic acid kinase [Saprospiraceae bacterium]
MHYSIIGAMSGSSLDGLDLALCHFDEKDGHLTWSLEHGETISFPENIQDALRLAHTISGSKLMELDAVFGKFIGEEIQKWSNANDVTADCIASHGHTVFHEPSKSFTTQIGSGAHIAFATGIDTITNFRTADVAAGGQGAPFAPVADKDLFPGYQAYLNLGGIVNASGITSIGKWKGWDIGPCNQALNHLAIKLGHPYDYAGQIASQGKVIRSVLDSLVTMFPYNEAQPKGLSNAEVKNTWIKFLDARTESVIDLLATTTEAIAFLILNHLQIISGQSSKILVTGGGAHNLFLMKRLEVLGENKKLTFELPESTIIDYKECLLMGYLGFLTLQGKPYGIHQMTGASADSIGGAMHKAHK